MGGYYRGVSDLSVFMRGIAEGLVFGNRTVEALEYMLGSPIPTGIGGVSYGMGVHIIDASDDGLGRIWGHDGWCYSFMYYCDELKVAVVGTLNQLNNDWWPAVRKSLLLVRDNVR